MTKKLFTFLVFVCVICIIGDFCQKQTKGFRLQNILKIQNEEIFLSKKEGINQAGIQKILSQPFYFLKKGQQCYVFSSEDGNYVVKFLRADKVELPRWKALLPSFLTEKQKQHLKAKRLFDLTSYQIAHEELFDETGIVFAQIGTTTPPVATLTLYDNIKVKHALGLKGVCFILQKKTEDFYPYLQQCLKNNDLHSLHAFFSDLAYLIKTRKEKGISDSDISLEYNMGILDGKPILFDIGNLRKKENIDEEEEANLILSSLQSLSPDLCSFFKQKLENN